jgi:hypothetical protein
VQRQSRGIVWQKRTIQISGGHVSDFCIEMRLVQGHT